MFCVAERCVKEPPIPSNEQQRLAALASYDILDSGLEREFDAITKLVALTLEVPVALVSIVDEHRQWFKSRLGLDVEETARSISFCGHVVSNELPLIVHDAKLDERFADNPLVLGQPQIRFYAGFPLRTPDGLVLGTLCAIDQAPRQLSPEQLEALELLSGQVASLLQLRRRGLLLKREQAQRAAQELELQKSEARLQALFDGMVEGVVFQDGSGAILACNPAAEQLLGLTREQLMGRTSIDPRWQCLREDGSMFPGDEHPAMVSLRTGKALTNVVMGVTKPNGGLTWICINARPLIGREGDLPYAVIATFRDVTDAKAAAAYAEQMSKHERLVTTGTLAAGVGHEINNPLTYVLTNIDFAIEELRSLAGGSPSARLNELIGVLGEAREGGERVRKIVRGLRALAREDGLAVPTAVPPLIDVSLNMAMHEIRQKAAVEVALDPVPLVLADESRLTQVLVNLLVNASQAFSSRDKARNRIVVKAQVLAEQVEIAISDNGPGIAADVLPRIFDPFFTTKSMGQGTGLGLAISHSIVTSLGGTLRCETVFGAGTTFRVLLPIAPPEQLLPGRPATPRTRVLVIDDEEPILRSIERVLQGEHEVVLMQDSQETLPLLQRGESFELIFCDLMMPNLSGVELFRLVESTHPELCDRFVFVTGGGPDPEVAAFLANVPNERVEKPFSVQNLRGIAKRFARSH